MRLLAPLRRRDFALVFAGSSVSLVGDGVYTVALAFQVLALDNDPTSLSLVLLCFAGGLVACSVWSGVLIDRSDRRRVIMAADAAQLVAVLFLGVLSLRGDLALWHCAVASAVVGAGTAFVKPAATALLPALVPPEDIVAATSLQQSVQQAAVTLSGPALGGLLVGAIGPGSALVIDAGTFGASIAALAAVRARDRPARGAGAPSAMGELREGLAYVRARTWLWGPLSAACISVLCVGAPIEVALPYVVKNDWGRSAGAYGLLLTVAGAGGVIASLVIGARGLPARPITAMIGAWALGTAAVGGFGLAGDTAVALPFALLLGLGNAGDTVWFAMLQTRVAPELLGRVSSLDWLLSMALLPVSFALTGPLAAAFGARQLLVGAAVVGTVATLGLLVALPGLRERAAAE